MSLLKVTALFQFTILVSTLGSGSLPDSASIGCSYSLHDVNESAEEVSLSLRIQLTNRTAAEIHYGVLRVTGDEGAQPTAEPISEFNGLSMPPDGSVTLESSLVFAPPDQGNLIDGGRLSAEIAFADENGVARELGLSCELMPEPGQ